MGKTNRGVEGNFVNILLWVALSVLLNACGGGATTSTSSASTSTSSSTPSVPSGVTAAVFKYDYNAPITHTFSDFLTMAGIGATSVRIAPDASTMMDKVELRVRNDIHLIQKMIEYRLGTGSATNCTDYGAASAGTTFFYFYTNASGIFLDCSNSTKYGGHVTFFDEGLTGSGNAAVHTYEFFAYLTLNDRVYNNVNGYYKVDSAGAHIEIRPFEVTQVSTNSVFIFNYLNYDWIGDAYSDKTVQFAVANTTVAGYLAGNLITGGTTTIVNPGQGSVNLPYLDVATNSRHFKTAETLPTVTFGFDGNNDGTLDSFVSPSVGTAADAGLL